MKISTKWWVKFEGQAGGSKFCRGWKIFSILLLEKSLNNLHVTWTSLKFSLHCMQLLPTLPPSQEYWGQLWAGARVRQGRMQSWRAYYPWGQRQAWEMSAYSVPHCRKRTEESTVKISEMDVRVWKRKLTKISFQKTRPSMSTGISITLCTSGEMYQSIRSLQS